MFDRANRRYFQISKQNIVKRALRYILQKKQRKSNV